MHKQCVYSCMWFRITMGLHFSNNVPRRTRLMQSKEIKTPQVQNSNVQWWNSWRIPLLNSKRDICQAEGKYQSMCSCCQIKKLRAMLMWAFYGVSTGGPGIPIFFFFLSTWGNFLPVSQATLNFHLNSCLWRTNRVLNEKRRQKSLCA